MSAAGCSARISPATDCAGLVASLGVKVARLVTDSREVMPGDTFVAYPGGRADGRQYITQAIASGANAVIWEAHNFKWDAAWNIPNVAVMDLRHHAGEIAGFVYNHPSEQLWMVGVTGTNGKTSCSHWTAQSFNALGKKSALVGTLGNGFEGALEPSLNTTPDAVRLHSLLADYLDQGAQVVAMEVSSHALEQGRVNGVRFDVALLTNLSRDHLDYHGDMEHYAAAKRKLFEWDALKYAVINLDDAFGADLVEQLQDEGVELVGYGLTTEARQLAAHHGLRMVYGDVLRMDAAGLSLKVHSSWGAGEIRSAMIGRFNAANLLGVLAVLLVSNVTLDEALQQLGRVRAAPGRMQLLGGKGRPAVVVDYAHTPDALEKVLEALQEMAREGGGRLICVFGCGGDRDRGKRPMMGKVAGKMADQCIVTSDNPRHESPMDIIADIESGLSARNYRIIEDRAAAITHAIHMAHAADTVLLAGKGHESYQEIGGKRFPFSDVDVALSALQTWQREERA